MKKWTKKKKEEMVKLLTEEFKNSKINILGTFSGLTVSEMQKMRESIKEVGGKLMVLKNRMVEIILKNLSKDEACKFINGQTFVIWSSQENEIEIIKSILKFKEQTGKIEINGGFIGTETLNREKIEQIGKLPGKRELQGKIVYLLQLPILRLINSLKGPIVKTINILNEIKTKKES